MLKNTTEVIPPILQQQLRWKIVEGLECLIHPKIYSSNVEHSLKTVLPYQDVIRPGRCHSQPTQDIPLQSEEFYNDGHVATKVQHPIV